MTKFVVLFVWAAVTILVELLLSALKAWLNDTASPATYNKDVVTFMVLNAAHILNSISMCAWLVVTVVFIFS